MTDINDHDMLVSLKTLMEVMIKNQSDFQKSYEERHTHLVSRISILEQSDSRDSERFKSILEQIQRSLNNSSRIDTLTADVNNLGENLRKVENKSNLFDIVNGMGVAIAAALGLRP